MTRHSTIANIAFNSIVYSSDPLSFFRADEVSKSAAAKQQDSAYNHGGSSHQSVSAELNALLLGILISRGFTADIST